jgi:hypothetical protein
VFAWTSATASPVSHCCQASLTDSSPNYTRRKPALAIAEHYVSFWRAYPSTEETPSSEYHSYAAHEALHEARDIIDCVVEELRIQVAGGPLDADQKPTNE